MTLGATSGNGNVTSVGITSTDLVISGSPITNSGTITLNLSNTGVTAGTYRHATVTVDKKGRITTVTAGPSANSGNYPNTIVYRNANGNFTANIITARLFGTANSSIKWSTARTISLWGDVTGSVSIDGSNNVSFPVTLSRTGVNAGVYGNATTIPSITVDDGGRVLNVALTPVTVNGSALSIANAIVTRNALSSFAANVVTANSFVGTASNAVALKTTRFISLSGDASGSVPFNGLSNATIVVTLANSGVTNALGYIPFSSNGGTISGTSRFTGSVVVDQTYPRSGIVFNYGNATSINAGFFGWDANVGHFTFVSSSVNESSAYDGSISYDGNITYQGGVIRTETATIEANLLGNVTGTASKLSTPRSISIIGDISGSVSFDGSSDVAFTAVMSSTGVTAGSYSFPNLTVDSAGRITSITSGQSFSSLPTPRNIALGGDLSGSVDFDGSSDVTLTASLTNSGVTAGSYTSANVTVDAAGRVTSIADGPSFTATIAQNGMQVLPFGLIMQWGQGDSSNAILFSSSFPNSVFSVTVTPQDADCVASYSMLSNTGFTPSLTTWVLDNSGTMVQQPVEANFTYIALGN